MSHTLAFRRLREPELDWRPALQTTSLVLLMLGISFVAVLVTVVWISTPEAVSLTVVGADAAIVRGGQSFAEIEPAVRQELRSAVILIGAGVLGLALARGENRG